MAFGQLVLTLKFPCVRHDYNTLVGNRNNFIDEDYHAKPLIVHMAVLRFTTVIPSCWEGAVAWTLLQRCNHLAAVQTGPPNAIQQQIWEVLPNEMQIDFGGFHAMFLVINGFSRSPKSEKIFALGRPPKLQNLPTLGDFTRCCY